SATIRFEQDQTDRTAASSNNKRNLRIKDQIIIVFSLILSSPKINSISFLKYL
ncbi:unnamed protein product, partial [Linum tenue]